MPSLETANGTNIPATAPFSFFNRTRYAQMLLSTVCLSLITSNSVTLNFTIICMTETGGGTGTSENGTMGTMGDKYSLGHGRRPEYSVVERSFLFSAIAIGCLMGIPPLPMFITRYGVRRTLTAYGLLSALATLLTPYAARIGIIPLILMRIFQGFALSICFPIMGAIVNSWSTLANTGFFLAVIDCHCQLGPIIAMPLSGLMCGSRWGWPAAYYLEGAVTLGTILLFFAFYRDAPERHRSVSPKELASIQRGKSELGLGMSKGKRPPYAQMIRDRAVWGVFASDIGMMLGFQIFVQYGPLYLNKVLHLNVESTGFAAALPYLLSALLKFFIGPLSDFMTCLPLRERVRLFATTSQMSMAGCFITLALLPPLDYPFIVQACFTAATVFSGLQAVGVEKAATLMGRQYSYVLLGVTSFTNSILILLLPVAVSLIAQENTPNEWSRLFFGIAAIQITAGICYALTTEVEPRPWTNDEPPRHVKNSNNPTKPT